MTPINGFGGVETASFEAFYLKDQYLHVPRYYGLKHFGPAEAEQTWKGNHICDDHTDFAGQLTQEQSSVAELVNEAFFPASRDAPYPRGGVLVLPCGYGKTVISIYLISRVLKQKSIILVHKYGLLEQWCERIRHFAPRLTVGIHRQQRLETDCDVLVAMIQTVARRDYASGELNDRSLAIVDECHHLGAPVFHSAMNKLSCAWTLGLSATPERKDGLSKVLYMTIGPVLHRVEREKECVWVTSLKFAPRRARTHAHVNRDGRPLFSAMITELTNVPVRNATIARHTARLHSSGRIILLLSERIRQLEIIKDLLLTTGIPKDKLGMFVRRSTLQERQMCSSLDVILSTFQMAREGIDFPRLNCLIMASPCSDLVQPVGRILRNHEKDRNGPTPLVFDVMDTTGMLESMAKKRKTFYKSNGFTVQSVRSDQNVAEDGSTLFY